MTPHDELDLQLRGWMQNHRTLAPRPGLADDAVARTVTVRQRPAVLAPSGESATALRIGGLPGARRAILLVGAILLLIAMVGAFAASRPPADRGRLLVSVGATFHLIEPDGRTIARTLSIPLDGAVPARPEACSSIIPGTDVVSWRDRFRGVRFASIGDPQATVGDVSLNFAGTEWWSPDRRRLLLVEYDAVTVVDLTDPRRPERDRFEAPALVGAAIDHDGRWLAVALTTLGHISLQIFDVATGLLRSSVAVQVPPPPTDEGPSLPMSLSPDGSFVAIQPAEASAIVIVDAATGAAREALPAGTDLARARWSPDGRGLAVPKTWDGVWLVPAAGGEPVHLVRDGGRDPRQLAWSPDGSRLAFRLGPAALVTVAPDGSGWTEHPLLSGAFVWSRDGSLVVVRSSADHESSFVERVRPEGDAPAEWIATLPGAGGDAAVTLCIEWASAPTGP